MKSPATNSGPTIGHLEYYKRHGISPVRYHAADLSEHLQRRDSLYRVLGLPAVAFKGARVLEVAPGSGQNSLYVATCRPATYDLVEPNPTGLRDIETAYADFDVPHTRPTLHPVKAQDFRPADRFDIVICENWLGSLPAERAVIAALAALVAPGGAMVTTAVPLAGFFPNVMRKLLAMRLTRADDDFEAATERLLTAFSPHLATIDGMTRSHRDWVHDCMLNPHYLYVALPFETLLAAAGEGMEVLATCPRFVPDWRWFKGMVGAGRAFNERLLAGEAANLHNFIDHRHVRPPRDPEDNAGLAAALDHGYQAALAWQDAHATADTARLAAAGAAVSACLDRLRRQLDGVDAEIADAFAELRDLWDRERIAPADVASLSRFGRIFGRETVYVSLTRAGTDG